MVATILGREVSFGLQYNFRNPPQWKQDPARLYEETFEHIVEAERVGFDYAWTTEHHFMEDAYSPSVLLLCSAIAARTSQIRLGTQILIAPFYDPLRLAEDVATLDTISNGRFELGLGLGYRIEEFSAFGVSHKDRARRTDELIQVMRLAWGNDPLTFRGRFFEYESIQVTPKPTSSSIPIWLGVNSAAGARRAARVADGMVGGRFIDDFLGAWLKGLRPGKPRMRHGAVPWVLIAEDPEAAWAEFGANILYQKRLADEWRTNAGRQAMEGQLPLSVQDGMTWNPDIIVRPERALELLLRVVGETDERVELSLSWYAIPPGVPPLETVESLRLFTDVVAQAEALTP